MVVDNIRYEGEVIPTDLILADIEVIGYWTKKDCSDLPIIKSLRTNHGYLEMVSE